MSERGEKIKILAHEYEVRVNGDVFTVDQNTANMTFSKQLIQISAHHGSTRRAEGLLHEVLEGLNYHLELQLEHRILTSISEGLFQVLNDNDLINWEKLNEIIT